MKREDRGTNETNVEPGGVKCEIMERYRGRLMKEEKEKSKLEIKTDENTRSVV